MTLDARAAHVLTLVEERMDDLVGRIVARAGGLYDERSDDVPVPAEEMAANASAMVRAALVALREGRPPTEDELVVATMLGERRARQGVSLETLLRSLRVGGREALVLVQDVATVSGLDARDTLTLTAALWDWIDDICVAVAEAHRSVEVARARSDEQQRASFVHGLVRGTLDPRLVAERASAFGLDPDGEHVVVCLRPADDAARRALELELVPHPWSPGVIAEVDEDLVAILPAKGGQTPACPPPVPGLSPACPGSDPGQTPLAPGGIAGPVTLGGLPRAHRAAARAAAAAQAAGRTGIFTLDTLAFEAADDHLGALLAARYVAPVRALGAFGEELLTSLRTFADHDQNIEAAARVLHVHPNTLRHRLGRYEETVGVSLRNVGQLAQVWWALTYDAQQVLGAGTPANRSPR